MTTLPDTAEMQPGRRAALRHAARFAAACIVTVPRQPARGEAGRAAMTNGLRAGRTTPPGGHVVLLGDSTFDNAAYVERGEPDVAAQLRARLALGWRVTRVAVDGAATGDVARQLDHGALPPDASHLAVSVGGNDALRQEHVLGMAAHSVAEALDLLADVRERFARNYRAMLDAVLARGLPVAVCTVYDPRFPDPRRRRAATTGLSVFNDVITREAFARGLALIDLRLVCARDQDFANPIEPSARGGANIAAAIAEAVTAGEPAAGARGHRRSEVFAGGGDR